MKRLIALILIASLALAGCGGQKPTASADSNSVTFTDDLGRTVTVQSHEKVAALLGSFAQIWMLAGGDVASTAEDAWEDLELELPAETVCLGSTKSLSLEKLFEVQPDFIIASTNTRQDLEWKETLESAGIPVAYFDVGDFDAYLRVLDIFTDITGRKDLYQENGLKVQSRMEAVLEKSRERLSRKEAPSVLCIVASASSIRAKKSDGNVLGEMLRTLGCVNIADSDKQLLENLSTEYILLADPDAIFFVQRGADTDATREKIARDLESSPLWSELTAVKEGRVFFMDRMLYNFKPNHRWAEAYEQLEEILSNVN